MKKYSEIALALDTLREKEFSFKNKLKINHFMDYNEMLAKYEATLQLLEWILEMRTDLPFLEQFNEIAEESWMA